VTRPDPHASFEELAGGYALHALEPDEEQVFRAHLASCARCERDVAEHEAMLAQLAYAPEAPEPPASLLAGIRAGVQSSGRASGLTLEPPAAPAPTPLEEARRRRDASKLRRAGTWMGLAAAFALVVSLGYWNTALRQDRTEQDAWSSRMAAAVAELRDDDTEVVPLHGDAGEVVAVALLRGEEMSLVVDGLPANDAGTSYVLWGETRLGDKRAVGAFDVGEQSPDVHQGMRLQEGISDVTKLMVTHEHGDEPPPIPTLPVLASGTV
jgi:anti-sigma-K factor RskA